MDNLTHSLVGLLIARAAPKGSIPQAAAVSIVAANMPDIDTVTVFDAATYIEYHRHLTHAVVAIPAMAALAVAIIAIWVRVFRREVLLRQYGLALIAVGSHVLLDLTNSYATRLWLPFSGDWSSWDLFFIIDPVIWALLLLAAVMPTRRAAGAGLMALVLYGAATFAIKQQVQARADQALIRGERPLETHLFPAPWTPWRWMAYVRTAAGVYSVLWDGLGKVGPSVTAFQPADPAALAEIRATPLGRAYLDFAQFPLLAQEGERTIRLGDFRFIREGRPVLSCRFVLDEEGRIEQSVFDF